MNSYLLILGMLHVLQPGHGKTVLMSYMALSKSSWRDALRISATFGLVHTSFLLVLGLISIVFFQNVHGLHLEHELELFFASAIILLGFYFFFLWYFQQNTHQECNHSPQNGIWLGIFTGLTPCPATLALLLANSHKPSFGEMLFSVLVYGFGITLTITSILLSAQYLGNRLQNLLSPKIQSFVPLINASVITAMGLYYFYTLLSETHAH